MPDRRIKRVKGSQLSVFNETLTQAVETAKQSVQPVSIFKAEAPKVAVHKVLSAEFRWYRYDLSALPDDAKVIVLKEGRIKVLNPYSGRLFDYLSDVFGDDNFTMDAFGPRGLVGISVAYSCDKKQLHSRLLWQRETRKKGRLLDG